MNRLAYLIKNDRGKLSRKVYCEITGFKSATLVRIETGKNVGPKILKKCSNVLNLPIGDIIDAYNEQL